MQFDFDFKTRFVVITTMARSGIWTASYSIDGGQPITEERQEFAEQVDAVMQARLDAQARITALG